MKTKVIVAIFATTYVGTFSHQAKAAISITNFNLSTNSVTFDIIGTLPSTTPDSPHGLSFYNPHIFASPGFVIGPDFLLALSYSFSGSQLLDRVNIGRASDGDYFFIVFVSDLLADEAINGTFDASWSSTVFDPVATNLINVEWGLGPSGIGSSVQLGSVSVPEASSSMLLCLAVSGLIFYRRRAHK
jgi:hypothetical protein